MFHFTADMHLGHANILRLCDRPFATITEHDDTIIKRHNEVVSDKDKVFDLGDLGFRCPAWYLAKCLEQMKGKRIVFLGNHDKPFRQAWQKGLFRDLIKNNKLEVVGGETAIEDYTLSIFKMLNIDGQKAFVGHYALRTWPNAFRGAWHLYGHSHGNLKDPFFKSFDVGVDSHNFYPWSEHEIKERMTEIENHFQED